MWIAITVAGSESEELTISQSGNAIDLARTVNLRNTLRFVSLVLEFWNYQGESFDRPFPAVIQTTKMKSNMTLMLVV